MPMKKISTLVTLLILFQNSFAQQSKFSKIYFDNANYFSADGMVKSFDGGLIVTGIYNYTSSVMKIDSLGSVVWANSFGFGQNESVNAVVRTTDSCYVMAGKAYDILATNLDIQITKIGQSGNLIWSKIISLPEHQEAFAISPTDDGGFILTGNEGYISPPHNRILVSKLDSLGDVEWLKVFQGGNNSNYGNSVKQTPDGGYAVIGYVEDYPPFNGNGLLLKLSSTGIVEWANKYNTVTPSVFVGNDLVITQDGIISYYSTGNEHAIIKTNFSGNDYWRETISGAVPGMNILNTVSSKMKLLQDGNLVFATGNRGFASQSSIVCIDSTGGFNWSQYITNSSHDIEEADDHGFFILGNGPLIGVRTTTITNPHVGIIKSDSLGNADLCTSINPSVSINFGTTTQDPISITVISYSAFSTAVSPINSAMVISEMTSCVDFIGGIEDWLSDNIEISPNPSHSSFNLHLPGLTGNILINIQDASGRITFSQKRNVNSSDVINIEPDLSAGIYFLSVNSSANKIIKKIVVQ